jgi:cephalosporin hydroxylase
MTAFDREVEERVKANGQNKALLASAEALMKASLPSQYSYNFSWLGRPIIQYPQDIVAMQELIWRVQPDLIVETGIAHGGSLIFSASMLELNAACGGPPDAKVIGVDIDIRAHNRAAIESHPMFRRIQMIQGSSIAPEIVEQVKAISAGRQRVMVCLDSNHTHDHVLSELVSYAPMTSVGSYCVVFDTVVEDMPAEMFPDRPWGPGNNPKTAVREFLRTHDEFEIDAQMDRKLLISVAPDGYLKRTR